MTQDRGIVRYGMTFAMEDGYRPPSPKPDLSPPPPDDPKRLSLCDQKRLELVAQHTIPDLAKMVISYARRPCCPPETKFGLYPLHRPGSTKRIAGFHRDDDCDVTSCDCLPEHAAFSAQFGDKEPVRKRIDLAERFTDIWDGYDAMTLDHSSGAFRFGYFPAGSFIGVVHPLKAMMREFGPPRLPIPLPEEGVPRDQTQTYEEWLTGRTNNENRDTLLGLT